MTAQPVREVNDADRGMGGTLTFSAIMVPEGVAGAFSDTLSTGISQQV